jgi:hypothetical protein
MDRAPQQVQPDPTLLGGFLAYQMCEWPERGAFGLPEGAVTALCSGLESGLQDAAVDLLPLYLAYLFREATLEAHGVLVAGDTVDTATATLRRTDRPGPQMAERLESWVDAMDLQTENLDHAVGGVPVPFEAWVAGAWLLEGDGHGRTGPDAPPPVEDAMRLALVLLRARRRVLPWIAAAVADGGLNLMSAS